MTGVYTGADGREYRVRPDFDNDAFEVQVWLPGLKEWRDTFLRVSDIPTAKAALDALVAEGEEWVEWKLHAGTAYRCRPDGAQPEVCNNALADPQWDTIGAPVACSSFYRKGREVALEESTGLRDAARELVEVVKDMPTFNQVDCWDWLKAVKAAAKALEGKL